MNIAISNALIARCVRSDRDACHLTINALEMAMMNATYTHPVEVLTYVKSANHRTFGAEAAKRRLTRSACRSNLSSLTVVRIHVRPRLHPCRP